MRESRSMPEFRRKLYGLLREEAIVEIIECHENGLMTFDEAIKAIAERIELEKDVYWEVVNNSFIMAEMTEEDLKKKIKSSKTSVLLQYMAWKRGDQS